MLLDNGQMKSGLLMVSSSATKYESTEILLSYEQVGASAPSAFPFLMPLHRSQLLAAHTAYRSS